MHQLLSPISAILGVNKSPYIPFGYTPGVAARAWRIYTAYAWTDLLYLTVGLQSRFHIVFMSDL